MQSALLFNGLARVFKPLTYDDSCKILVTIRKIPELNKISRQTTGRHGKQLTFDFDQIKPRRKQPDCLFLDYSEFSRPQLTCTHTHKSNYHHIKPGLHNVLHLFVII